MTALNTSSVLRDPACNTTFVASDGSCSREKKQKQTKNNKTKQKQKPTPQNLELQKWQLKKPFSLPLLYLPYSKQ